MGLSVCDIPSHKNQPFIHRNCGWDDIIVAISTGENQPLCGSYFKFKNCIPEFNT